MAEDGILAHRLFEACAAGDVTSVQTLLQKPAYIAKALETEERIEDEELQFARPIPSLRLMFNKAASAGSSDIINCLLLFAYTHGVPYKTLIRRDSICAAISSSDSVSVFRELHTVDPDFFNMRMGHIGTPLGQTVSGTRNAPRYTADRAALVRFLLENGANPNQRQGPDFDDPGTCLQNAVHRSTLDVVELLIQHGAQIEQSGAMHKAAETG